MKSKSVEVVYLGERLDFLNRIQKVFRDAKGETYSFVGIKHVLPGWSYLMSDAGTMPVKPVHVEEDKQTVFATEDEKGAYEVHKLNVRNERLFRRKEMQLKKPHPDIVKAVKLLRPFAAQLDHYDLSRFTGYIKNEISKKGKRK